GACRARVTPRAAEERPEEPVARGRRLAAKLAEDLIAAFVRPDGATHQAGETVIEHDRFRAESQRRARRPGKHQRSVEIRYGSPPIAAERDCLALADRGPCPLEFAPLTRGGRRLRTRR